MYHKTLVFFAKRPWKEPARMLFARKLLIIKIVWYMVGLCWLDIPASHRRWPPDTFQWPIELTLLRCASFLDSSRTFSLSIATVLKFTSCTQTYRELQFAILPSGLSGWFSELLGVTERLSFTPLWNLIGLFRGAVLWNQIQQVLKKPFPCFLMNLLNVGDLTNALSQQCWQSDRSHPVLPLCQHRFSGGVGGCMVQLHKRLWQHMQRLRRVAAVRTEWHPVQTAPI